MCKSIVPSYHDLGWTFMSLHDFYRWNYTVSKGGKTCTCIVHEHVHCFEIGDHRNESRLSRSNQFRFPLFALLRQGTRRLFSFYRLVIQSSALMLNRAIIRVYKPSWIDLSNCFHHCSFKLILSCMLNIFLFGKNNTSYISRENVRKSYLNLNLI